eukprot:gene9857-10868_t
MKIRLFQGWLSHMLWVGDIKYASEELLAVQPPYHEKSDFQGYVFVFVGTMVKFSIEMKQKTFEQAAGSS